MISILVIVFAMVLLGEHMKLKKEVRKLGNQTKHLKKDIEQLKQKNNSEKE